jgi:hypothetical protein
MATDRSEDASELAQLQAENQQLQMALVEMQTLLEEKTANKSGNAQAKEYERLLEQKNEVIRTLHMKLQELQERPSTGPAPREDELLTLSEELEKERRQLKEDEESLMQQMREMEIQISKERAELARQRSELQRLHNEIRHDLELASRDTALRERLAPLQRRHQEIVTRRGAAPAQGGAPNPAQTPAPAPAPSPQNPRQPKDSSLLRRFFGSQPTE